MSILSRRIVSLASLTGCLCLPAATARAATIDLSWNDCSSIVASLDPATPGPVTLYASITGMGELSQAYEVWLYLADGKQQLPDAWRFDEGGCQGPNRVRIESIPPAALSKTCPPFPPEAPRGLVIHGFRSPVTSPLLPGGICNPGHDCALSFAMLARYYGPTTIAPDPNQRYFLASWEFDLTNSVVGEPESGRCGGFERGLRVWLHPTRACYATLVPNEIVQFQPGQGEVSFHGEPQSVPAASTTWGQIKSQYRR